MMSDCKATMEWVPVHQKMPPENVYVLAYTRGDEVYVAQYVNNVRWGFPGWFRQCKDRVPNLVTHWMPLPKGPDVITRDLIERGYKAGLVKVIDICDVVDEFGAHVAWPDEHETVCQIGNSWLYFAGPSGEGVPAEEYLAAVPEEDIINEIYDAICGLADDWKTNGDEVDYYYFYLTDHLDCCYSRWY